MKCLTYDLIIFNCCLTTILLYTFFIPYIFIYYNHACLLLIASAELGFHAGQYAVIQ